MSKHVFLTGDIQSGKSTVIQKVLANLDVTVGGFCSGYGPDRAAENRLLYLWDAAEAPAYDEAHSVAQITPQGRKAFPERFDILGCNALRRARETNVDLILMDECGFLERDAAQFQAEVLKTLDGACPVFGVVRLHSSGWTDSIRNHPNVTLITVTKENRDILPDQITALLKANKK